MPSTEGLTEKLTEAGRQGRQAFERGFSGGGTPETLGGQFGSKFMSGLQSKIGKGDFGALGTTIDKLGEQVDAKLAAKLKGALPEAYRQAATAANELREAEERLARATELVNDRSRTETMLQFVAAKKEQYHATKDLEGATARAASTQADYTEKMTQFRIASQHTFNSASLLGGLVGGGLVVGFQALTGAMEGVIHLGEHIFDESLHGAEELTEKLVEAGEQFQNIGNQVTEFSGASGPALDELKDHAAAVFGTLDVAGQDVGRTMSELSTRLHMGPGQALNDLTRKVEDLGGRFRSLKPESIATLFTDFGIGADQANSALDTLVTNAQQAGVDLGSLTSLMAGPVSETLKEAGLTFGQTAHVVALLSAQGIPATDVVRGLGASMKTFAKDGLSFKDGIAEARKELQQLGDTEEGNKLAQQLFGTKWVDAVKVIDDLNQTLSASPGQLDGAADAAQNLIDNTETLSNKIQSLKNKAATAFKPFEEGAVSAVENGLNKVENWFDQHHDEIFADIKRWGDEFIDLLPKVKEFASVTLRLLEPLATGLSAMFAPVAEELIAASAGFLALTGHFDEAKDMLKLGVQLPILEGKALSQIDKLADKIDSIQIDTDTIKSNFNDAADAAAGIGNSLSNLPGMSQGFPMAVAPPGAPSAPGTPGAPSTGPGGEPLWAPSQPGGVPVTPNLAQSPFATPWNQGGTAGTDNPLAPKDSAYSGSHADLWRRVANAEASGNWSNADSGRNGHYGGLQFAQATWDLFGGKQFADRADHASPDQQMIVADRVAFTGWNGVSPQGLGAWQTVTNGTVGLARGGEVGMGLFAGFLDSLGVIGGGKGGIDDILIRATRGETVMNKGASEKYGALLQILNARGYEGGGQVDQFGVNTAGAQIDTIRIADALAQIAPGHKMYLYRSPDGFDEHSSGEAVDFMVGTDRALGNSVKNWALQQPGVMYALWQQRQWNPDGSISAMDDRGGATQNHMDHVHIRTHGGGYPPGMGPNETGLAFGKFPSGTQLSGGGGGAITAAGWGGAGGGASAISYGSGGGGMTPSQQIEHDKRIRDANDRIGNTDRSISEKQQELSEARGELTRLQGSPDHLSPDRQKNIDQQNRKIQGLEDDITRLNQQKLDAEDDLRSATASKEEAANKPGGRHEGRDGAYDAAQDLGRGFLGGIFQELGIPDVFGGGKSPLQFGGVKFGMGLLNWAASTFGGRLNPAAMPGPGMPIPQSGGQFPVQAPAGEPGPFGPQHGWPIGPGNVNSVGAHGTPLKVATAAYNKRMHTPLPDPGPDPIDATLDRVMQLAGAMVPGIHGGGKGITLHNPHFDNSQTWHVNAGAPKEITQAISNYSNSQDRAQSMAAAPGTYPAM